MSAGTVAELWADLIGEPAKCWSAPTPANPANSANREHSCGLPADFVPANRLRISANAGADSQEFAAIRNMENGPRGQQPCGFSQNSQDSQGCPEATHCEAPDLDLAPVAWTDADIARFLDRRARLMRWGWAQPQAEKLAERLHRRDLEGDDRRVCLECANLSGRRCGQWRQARLCCAAVPADLTQALQRCSGFKDTTP